MVKDKKSCWRLYDFSERGKCNRCGRTLVVFPGNGPHYCVQCNAVKKERNGKR